MLNRAVWYLGRRDYGMQELRQKLLRQRRGKPAPGEEACEQVITRLLELGYLDDERTARRLAESLSAKGYGARAIAFELRRRGIEEEAEPPATDDERLADLLQTKYAARLGDERGRHAVYQALLRRGYRHADIRSAIQEYMEEADFDAD